MFTLFLIQAEDGLRVHKVTGVQTCALSICPRRRRRFDRPDRGCVSRARRRGALARAKPRAPSRNRGRIPLGARARLRVRSEERRVGREGGAAWEEYV